MTTISWSTATSGDWTNGSSWIGGTAPGAGDDAVISVTGAYTVSLTTPISVGSITVGDGSATLSVADPGGSEVVTGSLSNAGYLFLDSTGGGTTLTVGGTLTNSNYVQVGNPSLSANTTLTAAAIDNPGQIALYGNGSNQAVVAVNGAAGFGSTGTVTGQVNLQGNALVQFGSGAITSIAGSAQLSLNGADSQVQIAGDTANNNALATLSANAGNLYLRNGATLDTTTGLDNSANLYLDIYGGDGGASLNVGGTLTNSDYIQIGNSSPTAGTTLTATAVDNTGQIALYGDSSGTGLLAVSGAAGFGSAGTVDGQVNLQGDALVQFDSGALTAIASGAQLSLNGADSQVQIAGDTANNNALATLSANAGNLYLRNGATLDTTTGLDNSGNVYLDIYGGDGGSRLNIGGTLTNSDYVQIGNSSPTAGTTLTATAVDNTSQIALYGDSSGTGVLAVSGAAGFGSAGTVTGQVNLQGDALVEFGSGAITGIAGNAQLSLNGAGSQVQIAGDTANNNALATLSVNAGNLYLRNGAALASSTGLDNSGNLYLDIYGGDGGSRLNIGGTLTNSGYVQIGNSSPTAGTTLTATAVDNTGQIALYGDSSGTGVLTVSGAAGFGSAGTVTGQVNLQGDALVEFGSGAITGIAGNAQLSLNGAGSQVQVAGDSANNNALTTLSANAGNFYLHNGATLVTTAGLDNSGNLYLDVFGGEGSSVLNVGGTLTNSGQVYVGNLGLATSTTLTAQALANTGYLSVVGNPGSASVGATLDVNTAAGFGTAGVLTGSVYIDGYGAVVFTGGQIGTIAAGASLELRDHGVLADAGSLGSNSALTALTENDGNLAIRYGDAISLSGNLLNTGKIYLQDEDNNALVSDNTIAGTLTNSGQIYMGNLGLTAPTTLAVGGLVNTGYLQVVGNSATATQEATLDVDAIAGFGTTGVLTGSVYIDGYGVIEFASGQIGTIARGASLELRYQGVVADAGSLGSNSALTGLTENDGNLAVRYGDAISLSGNLQNTGNIYLQDEDNNALVSSNTIAGTLTNSGQIYMGNLSLTGPTTLAVGGLVNTGYLQVVGNSGVATQAATLDVDAIAGFGTAGVLTGSVYIDGYGVVEFTGGQIGTIADGASLELRDHGVLADAGSLTSSSALTGLTENNGNLAVRYGDAISLSGNLLNTGNIYLQDEDNNALVSSSTIAGTLTNGGQIYIGNAGLTAPTTLTVGGLVSTGYLQIVGNAGTASDAATLNVDGAATTSGSTSIGTNATVDVAGSNGYTQTGGSTDIAGDLIANNVTLNGGVIALTGGTLQAGTITVANGASLTGHGIVTGAVASAGSIVASGGSLDLAGGLAAAAPISIAGTSALELAGADSGAIAFTGTSGILVLDDPVGFTGTISGLAVDDTLVLRNTDAVSATASYDSATDTSTLVVTLAGGGTLDLSLAGDYAGAAFGTNHVGNNTEIGAVGAAAGEINTTLPIALGTVRQGASTTVPVSITNNAPTGSAALDVSIGPATGGAFGTGSIVALAPGATDSSDIRVGIGAGAAGAQNGTVTLDFASDLGGGNEAPLPSVAVGVSGTVYRKAIAAITPTVLYTHVGASGIEALDVANIAPADGYSEALIASLSGVTGGFTAGSSAPTGDIAAGSSNTTALTLDFSTAQPGVVSGDALVSLTSDGGTGAGSIDGLGTIALPSQAVPISVDIDNYATAAIQAPSDFGTLTTIGNATTLDLGTIAEDSGPFDLNFGVANVATGPADVLSGSFIAAPAGGFTLTGLGDFSGLAAGQTITPGVTIDTTAPGVLTQTITLDPTDSNASGYSEVLPAQTLTITGTVAVLPPPTISVNSTLAAMTDVPALLGLSIGDPNEDTLPLTVTISDSGGLLTAQTSGSATVSGYGTSTLILQGDLEDLNDELATVAFVGAAVGSDTINISVEDQHHASATQQVTVDVSPVPPTKPIFNGPTAEMAVVGTATGFGGLSISDPSAEASGAVVSVGFEDPTGTLSVTGDYGGTIIGQGTGTLEIIATVPEINEYLSDGLLGDIGDSLGGIALTQLTGFIRQGTITIGSENLVTLGGGPEGKFFELGVVSATFAIDSLIGLIPGNTPPSRAQFISNLVNIIGDPHIVAANGAIFDFNAEGEFVLAAATQPGDSFDVQVRLQSFDNSPYASAVTQIAAQVGTDRVTFGTGRADIMWVDGTAASVGASGSLVLNGGEVTQLSADSYQVTWDTGEVLNVTDAGSFLDASIAPGPNNSVGSLVGLATLADTPADEFQLVNGTTLEAPLSSAALYQAYAEAWYVPQADSLFDYAPGQSTATFDNSNFPESDITLADLPAGVVAQAAAAVAAAGITDPGAAAAIEFDYIVSGGDPAIVAADASYLNGVTTTSEQATPSGAAPVAIGVIADQPQVTGNNGTTTAIVFDAYLTAASTTDEVINYAVVASASDELGASAFGGTLPTGQVTIAAGQVSSEFTIDVPAGGLGLMADSILAVAISSADGTPAFAPTAQATIVQPIPGPPAIPVLTDLTNLGSFSGSGTSYTLNLGQVQYGEPVPTIYFSIENAATALSDQLGGTITVAPVEGFTVTGATLPSPLGGGDSYSGLDVTVNSVKFGLNSETITFDPTDSNVTGYSAALQPITLTIDDTIVAPTMVYSYAWGDVHIITYNGLTYNFQAEGEFTLAQSRIPNDSFDIQMRLQPWPNDESVTVITQVAVAVGTDKVTFDTTRADTVYVDGVPSTISQSDPDVTLSGGTLTQVNPGTWQINWNTGETATITEWGGSFFDIADGIPLSEPDMVGGLQGEDAGASNDFQLSNGTVLTQPLTAQEEYGEFANSWRVTQASSLFDYLPGQTTATFTNVNFPYSLVDLSNLPSNVVTPAAQMVTDAGITDPGIAQDAELDYLATGDPAFIEAAQQVSSLVTNTTPVTIQNTTPPAAAVGVQANPAGYTEAASGPTATTFDGYLTNASTVDIVVNYTVAAPGAGFLGAAAFGGTLPSGSVTIDAGQTLVPFTIDVPQGALGTSPTGQLEVQISTPGTTQVFAAQAIAAINNNVAEPGVAPIPQLLEVSNAGTLIENSPTAYTLDLGTFTQGETSSQVQLGIANLATPPADELSGTFGAPSGTGFLVTGDSLPGAIIAGEQFDGLYVAPQTSTAGTNTETLVFTPKDVNASGFGALLAPITLTITDTVTAVGVGQLNTPQTIVFPNVHVGTPESQALDVSNTGSAPISVSLSSTSPIITEGSIASLGAGATDTTDLSVAVDTSSAGAQSGVASVNFGSSDPPVDVFGDVYRLASGTIAPIDAYVNIGSSGTVALAVMNTATADGFSENLLGTLVAVTGSIGIAAAGPTGEIAAGSSDRSSLLLDFSTAQAGTITGSATIDLTSDGGTGPGSIDGLGTTALAPEVVPVTITVENSATAAFENISGFGTFTNSGTLWSLNLGTVSEGSAPLAIDLGVLNAAAGESDLLSGSLAASGPSAFTASGLAAFSNLAAGQADIAPSITLSTDTGGTFTETITLTPSQSNLSGFSAALPTETLTVTGTVAPTSFSSSPAIASVSPTSPIDFGNVHVGATVDQALDISNTATAGAPSLDGSVQSTTGDATASGVFTDLAPGAPASTAISVGINTDTAGSQNGNVALAFVSDAGTAGIAALPGQTIAVAGTVYREADAVLAALSEIVHVGDPGLAAITVSNNDPDDGFSESLIAALIGTSGNISVANAGPTEDINAGSNDSSTLAIGFSTAEAGTITGTGTVGLTSDGGTGPGSIDGLGQTALPDQTAPVDITVDNYANAEITSDGNLTSSGTDAYTLNLGTTTQGSAALSATLGVLNDVAGPADWLSGTLAALGGSPFSNTGFGTFGTLDAGESIQPDSISLSTSQAGTFSETVVLTPIDSNASGFSEMLPQQTITVTGTVVAATATANGDVHMVSYDGIHYDFQADGSYMLTKSTAPGDNFQIQIQTAPDAADNAVSFTVLEAAQVGSDVVTFAINRPDTVWIDGTPDAALTTPGAVQTLDGGTLTELSATSYQMNWATGQTLVVTNLGAYLNTAVTPGAGNAGQFQGLLGTGSTNPLTQFQLPDGTVLPPTLSPAQLDGPLANAWSLTAADSLLSGAGGTGTAGPGAAPATIGTIGSSDALQFYAGESSAQDVLQATTPGQVLSAAAGADILSDAGGVGAVFQGTLSQFANMLLAGVSSADLIDVTGFNPADVSTSYAGSADAGVLYLSNGTQSGEVYLSGRLGGTAFGTASDGHGGTLISLQ